MPDTTQLAIDIPLWSGYNIHRKGRSRLTVTPKIYVKEMTASFGSEGGHFLLHI